jgi:hypothetical protein
MGIGDVYFMDLPVYRLPEEQYYRERDAWVQATYERYGSYRPDNPSPEMAEQFRQIEISARTHLATSYGGGWQYNEIVGFLQLYVCGSQVRAEQHITACKRVVRTRRKIFVWNTWNLAPETEIPRNGTNTEIFQAILEHVAGCRRELAGRYIDSTHLETLGPFVDWNALLSKSGNPYYA